MLVAGRACRCWKPCRFSCRACVLCRWRRRWGTRHWIRGTTWDHMGPLGTSIQIPGWTFWRLLHEVRQWECLLWDRLMMLRYVKICQGELDSRRLYGSSMMFYDVPISSYLYWYVIYILYIILYTIYYILYIIYYILYYIILYIILYYIIYYIYILYYIILYDLIWYNIS